MKELSTKYMANSIVGFVRQFINKCIRVSSLLDFQTFIGYVSFLNFVGFFLILYKCSHSYLTLWFKLFIPFIKEDLPPAPNCIIFRQDKAELQPFM